MEAKIFTSGRGEENIEQVIRLGKNTPQAVFDRHILEFKPLFQPICKVITRFSGRRASAKMPVKPRFYAKCF